MVLQTAKMRSFWSCGPGTVLGRSLGLSQASRGKRRYFLDSGNTVDFAGIVAPVRTSPSPFCLAGITSSAPLFLA
jgi:hypothetical protein